MSWQFLHAFCDHIKKSISNPSFYKNATELVALYRSVINFIYLAQNLKGNIAYALFQETSIFADREFLKRVFLDFF